MGKLSEDENKRSDEMNNGIRENASDYVNALIMISLLTLAGFLLYLVFK